MLYFPVTFVVFTVLEALREDDPKKVAKAAVRNLLLLSAVLIAGGAAVYTINRWM